MRFRYRMGACDSPLLLLLALSLVVYTGYSLLQSNDNDGEISSNGQRMFRFNEQELSRGKLFKVEDDTGNAVTYLHALELLRDGDADFTAAFLSVLRDSCRDYSAYFFETPGAQLRSAGEAQFEFVLNDASRSLGGVAADEHAFAQHFRKAGAKCGVAAFMNLGHDAKLVAPCPDKGRDPAVFAHLAAFVRGGDDAQVREFWRATAREMTDRLQRFPTRTTWLSTSGLGVYWLHMRLDSYPKYYTYKPYKDRKG